MASAQNNGARSPESSLIDKKESHADYVKTEREYLVSIDIYEKNFRLTTRRRFLLFLGKVEVPNRLLIKPTMETLQGTYEECQKLGYVEAAKKAKEAMRKRPPYTLKELLSF
jgi:hypothetical protein